MQGSTRSISKRNSFLTEENMYKEFGNIEQELEENLKKIDVVESSRQYGLF